MTSCVENPIPLVTCKRPLLIVPMSTCAWCTWNQNGHACGWTELQLLLQFSLPQSFKGSRKEGWWWQQNYHRKGPGKPRVPVTFNIAHNQWVLSWLQEQFIIFVPSCECEGTQFHKENKGGSPNVDFSLPIGKIFNRLQWGDSFLLQRHFLTFFFSSPRQLCLLHAFQKSPWNPFCVGSKYFECSRAEEAACSICLFPLAGVQNNTSEARHKIARNNHKSSLYSSSRWHVRQRQKGAVFLAKSCNETKAGVHWEQELLVTLNRAMRHDQFEASFMSTKCFRVILQSSQRFSEASRARMPAIAVTFCRLLLEICYQLWTPCFLTLQAEKAALNEKHMKQTIIASDLACHQAIPAPFPAQNTVAVRKSCASTAIQEVTRVINFSGREIQLTVQIWLGDQIHRIHSISKGPEKRGFSVR